ncbi:MAG: methylmalonyl-CoA mutase [Deltaproteobacteria bacterium]|nr:methylmalonyl-CoA mutase [Deltaproteobacteria bacterium]MBW1978841.1 methylmalonyl-CoA mutase [Deltaproteobacteria bacterium]MBW2044899.1 methylmalonyl-CoA mutase [Deltaproteobacteria bacterium]MBW2300791.1 methylmalonyl-CoA mutase [Deltaproteobacteria bacterium]
MKNLKNSKAKWEENTLKKALERSPERQEAFKTESDIPVKRLYTPLDLEDIDYEADLGFPGEYPYTRGVYPTMYRGRLWTMRNYAGFGTAEDTNKRYRYLLEQGMVGLSMAFDLPTQLGYDSDDPLAEGAVGRVGVAVDSLADMEVVFRDIPLEKVSTSMTINAPATILLAMYIAVGEKQGVPQEKLMGTTQNDILKEFIARGTYIFPPEPSIKLVLDIVEYCAKHVPRWNTLNIAGYHFREAGANAIQEVAFTLADAITYIEKAQERGLDVDYFAPRLSYSLGCYMDFFEEVAKFRAARRLFARIMKERFGAKNPKSYLFRIFTGSCGSTLVTQQPINNIVRVTMHALMGILGGDQAIHTACWDEGYAIPSEDSARLALRTQQILAHECGLCSTIDPLGGSYYVESLTNEIEERASRYLQQIEEMGGMLAAIDNGFVFREIQESSVKFQERVESGERIIVGLNKFATPEQDGVEEQDIFQVHERVETTQKQKLRELKARRNQEQVKVSLRRLKEAIDRGENLMPFIIEAVKSYATIGEICGIMRERWGEFKAPTYI